MLRHAVDTAIVSQLVLADARICTIQCQMCICSAGSHHPHASAAHQETLISNKKPPVLCTSGVTCSGYLILTLNIFETGRGFWSTMTDGQSRVNHQHEIIESKGLEQTEWR